MARTTLHEGWGDADNGVPMLAGQYTNYLWRQVDKYAAKLRIHDESEPEYELLSQFGRHQLRDIFVYYGNTASNRKNSGRPREGA